MRRTTIAIVTFALSVLSISAAEHRSLTLDSKRGVKGWTVADTKHSTGSWMNSTLVVVDKKKGEKRFRASRAFIEKWGFSDSDAAVVVSRGAHGPSWIEKFNLSTGELIAECSGGNYLKDTPDWAKPWCDDAKTPAEPSAPADCSEPGTRVSKERFDAAPSSR